MGKTKYRLLDKIVYYSQRFDKYVTVERGYPSDGATGAIDISGSVPSRNLETWEIEYKSEGWWVHDRLCDTGMWDDGTPCSNYQASRVLSDILWGEGRYVRSWRWFWATWFFGGGKARDNGMW